MTWTVNENALAPPRRRNARPAEDRQRLFPEPGAAVAKTGDRVLYQFALVIQCSRSNLAEPSLRLGAISEQLAEPRSLYEDASGPLADLDERTAALFIRVPIKMLS